MLKTHVIQPIQKFVNVESFSGILLFAATILALIWANSPYGYLYQDLFDYQIGIDSSSFRLVKPMILWINDGLMAIFFFLIGLEIKREIRLGELNSVKKASFPFFAAIGGMSIPALLFVLLNDNPATASGWAIPMATDIAFSLAILKLLGNRVSLNIKVFLTAFAIVDDLGAVMIIAIFYSSGIQWMLIAVALLLIAGLGVLSIIGKYNKYLMLILGVISWYLFLKAGVHPTIAGVLVAFTIPIRKKISEANFATNLNELAEDFQTTVDPSTTLLTAQQVDIIDEVETWTEKVQSPLQRMEHSLHGWVAYVIMPIFALANAGVTFSADAQLETGLIVALALALVVGNSIGISVLSFIGIKSKLAVLPDGVRPVQVLGVAFLAGVGFTMSIFIANLAFSDSKVLLDSAKIGILIGSLVSGVIGYTILRLSSKETA